MNKFNNFQGKIIDEIDSSIQPFMSKVYGWMTCGLILTSCVSWYASKIPLIINILYYNQSLLFALVFFQFMIVFYLSNMLHRLNESLAISLFMIYSSITGLTLSSIFLVYTSSSIFSTFLVTSLMFGCMTIYGYTTKNDLTGIGNIVIMLLFGVIITSIINILMENDNILCFINYINMFIFVGLVAYDTQKLKNIGNSLSLYDKEIFHKYAIFGALILYLDFINLFLIPLKILNRKNNK